MNLTRLKFEDEAAYRAARDINLDMLEAEGWKPDPSLDMLVIDERVGALRARLDAAHISYEAEDNA